MYRDICIKDCYYIIDGVVARITNYSHRNGKTHLNYHKVNEVTPIRITVDILKDIGFLYNHYWCLVLPDGGGVALCIDAPEDLSASEFLDIFIMNKDGKPESYLPKSVRFVHEFQVIFTVFTNLILDIELLNDRIGFEL